MGRFLHLVLFGLGLIALTVVVAGVGVMVLLQSKGEHPGALMKEIALRPEEKQALEEWRNRPPTAAEVGDLSAVRYDRELRELADKIGEATLRELIADLTRRQRLLDDRERALARRSENLQLAEADFHRLRQQVQSERLAVQRDREQLVDDADAWAQAQADEAAIVQALSEDEVKRLQDRSLEIAAMKNAWPLLRDMPVDRAARLLVVMEPKKAAKLLDQAIDDRSVPGLGLQIQTAMMTVDVHGLSADQAQRLANLVRFMKVDPAVSVLIDMSATEIDAVFKRLEDNPKKISRLLDGLRTESPGLASEVVALRTARGGAS
jgi:hypothetical protein